MFALEPIRLSPSLVSLLSLCLVSDLVPRVFSANQLDPHRVRSQVKINPDSVRLPIVSATDNRFVRLSTSQGQSQLKVDEIVQDNEGFMWFGTRYGLYRYDGYDMKLFVSDRADSSSLDGVAVHSLFKDHAGVLWVGCDQSLNKFDRATETFKSYPIPFANHITQDKDGRIWATSSTGLYRLDTASEEVRHYSHDPNDFSSLGTNDLAFCREDKGGAFWVSGRGFLEEFDRTAGKVIRHFVMPGDEPDFKFYEDRFGVFWIYHSSPHALSAFDRKTNTLTRYLFPEQDPTVLRLSAMLEDREGFLWIATHGLGLLKFDRERKRFISYMNSPTDPESLPQNKVDALFMDRLGNIWAAPGRLAPALLTATPPPFRRLPKVPGSSMEPFVGALYKDHQGTVWIGTPESLNRLDHNTGRLTAYKIGGPGVGTDVVSIGEDRVGDLWVGTYGHGLHHRDAKTGTFKTYRHNPGDPHSLGGDIVMALVTDHNGTLWAAGSEGLSRFDPLADQFTTYKLDPQKSVQCLSLLEDKNGNFWVGTQSSGLYYFNPSTGQSVLYQHEKNRPGTLINNRVNSINRDRSGAVWLGTQNGLEKLDLRTGTFTAYTSRDGLPGNAVGCVLEDKNSDLWMSTNNGVARFNPERKQFSNFSITDGLPGPNLTGWAACFQSPHGEMFFGGFNGGASFLPGNVIDSSYTPPVVLTDLRLFGNPVQIGPDFPLRQSIPYTKDLTLSHQQNVISFTFAALSYASPATNRYRYRLDGLDHNWNEVGSDRRQVTYTALPAGIYTFRAQGAIRNGPWSEPGAWLRIEILPPWWLTRPFQIGVSILLCLLAWAAYRQRIDQVARQFEARFAERARIARDLHDTLLQSFQASLVQMQAARNLYSRQPEHALQNLDEAITMTAGAIVEGRDAIQHLRSQPASHEDLARLLTVEGQTLARAQEENGTRVSFRVAVQGEQQDLEPILQVEVYRIARELLRNAFQHAQAKQIEAEIRYDHRELVVQIRDDGAGIDPEILKAGGRAGHYGLAGIGERAKRIGAHLAFWSEAGAGTEVEVTISGSIVYRNAHRRFNVFRRKTASS